MGEEIRALLVQAEGIPVATLRQVLEIEFIHTERAGSCTEAGERLRSSKPPHLVLTDTEFPDGNWTDVLNLAATASLPIGVIVVSPVADVSLYMDVMERRAYDFITYSFTAPELTHILRGAVNHVLSRRKDQANLPDRVAKTTLGISGDPLKEDLMLL